MTICASLVLGSILNYCMYKRKISHLDGIYILVAYEPLIFC